MIIEIYRLPLAEAEAVGKHFADDAELLYNKECVRVKNVSHITNVDNFIKIHTKKASYAFDEGKNLCIVYRSDF